MPLRKICNLSTNVKDAGEEGGGRVFATHEINGVQNKLKQKNNNILGEILVSLFSCLKIRSQYTWERILKTTKQLNH